MQQPTISIIVPVYNVKEYLARCVESLLIQNYEQKDIILIDDGSTDGSATMCDEYAEMYTCVKTYHKQNGGLMSAWIEGVNHSRGEYLCFVDSDDWVEPQMLQEMVVHLTGTKKEIVACNYTVDRVGAKPEQKENALSPGTYERRELEAQVFEELLGNEVRKVTFSRCMKLIKRELIDDNIKFCNPKIRMAEDVNIMLPAILDAERLVILKKAYYYHYFFNQCSIVHKYNVGLHTNINLLKQSMYEILLEKYKESSRLEKMLQRADMEYLFLMMLVLKNEARGNASECKKTIKAICREEQMVQMIKKRPLVVKNNANRLLYMVMKHPNSITITLLKLAMAIYDR